MPKLIEFVNIDKAFKTHKILDNLNLSINQGDLIGLIGKSGEGKTTLLRVLIGFYKIDSGSIIFKDKDITKKTSLIRDVVGFCTQDNSFYPELSIEENRSKTEAPIAWPSLAQDPVWPGGKPS